jgi:hypothetical protein
LFAQSAHDRLAIRGFLTPLVFIEANDVAPILDRDLFDLEWRGILGMPAVRMHHLITSPTREHLLGDLLLAAEASPEVYPGQT